jgi:hypothetical protein
MTQVESSDNKFSPLLVAGGAGPHSPNPGRLNAERKVKSPLLLLERKEDRSRPDGISNDPNNTGGESSILRTYQGSRNAVYYVSEREHLS